MRNNRAAGHGYERDIRTWFRAMGWHGCETSRYASREKDDAKIDLCYTDPFNVQLKYTQSINFHTELAKMPKDKNYNVVFHKRKNQGTIVAMSLKDFEDIVQNSIREGIIKAYDQRGSVQASGEDFGAV